jgi:potassium uptake TrkH family protein
MRRLKIIGYQAAKRIKAVLLTHNLHQILLHICALLIPFFAFIGFSLVLYDFGFKPFWRNSETINFWCQIVLNVLSILLGIRLLIRLFGLKKMWSPIFNLVGWLFILFLAVYILPTKAELTTYDTNKFVFFKLLLYAGIIITFITEASYLLQFIYSRSVSPALLFVMSFAFLIVSGTFLLKLPNATTGGIKLIDAIFTATSAVCVTGLTVVDTATHFTTFGKLIIIILIQIGGLGIMTFAGLLAYAAGGQTTLKTELAFRDMMSNRQIGNIMHFIYQVVSVTFLFEAIGTICIYFSLDNNLFDRKLDKLFFSIFHSVSAFCNAGFSTYTNNLFEPQIRYNYTLHIIIAFLIILGGIGFPIIFNLSRYLKIKFLNLMNAISRNPKRLNFPKLINVNSRLALVVTGFLLLIGFVTYLLFEQNHTLRDHPTLYGKIVTSFLGAVTPRTGGFNSVDMTLLSLPIILIYLLLMWIGASPGSMGGGIRTTTLGVAVLNVVSVLRGKDRSEFFKSEISHFSIRRAFAIILLSFFMIGVFTFLVSVNDGEKGLIMIAFETFSAFSTTGLSLGLTPNLSNQSKLVLVFTMLVGRVGMLTLFVAFIKQSKQLYYRYPKEEIAF